MARKKISIKYTRDNLADVVNDVAYGGNEYQITKFGKPIAVIIPVDRLKSKNTNNSISKKPNFKLLAHATKDIFNEQFPKEDAIQIQEKLRKKNFDRYEKS